MGQLGMDLALRTAGFVLLAAALGCGAKAERDALTPEASPVASPDTAPEPSVLPPASDASEPPAPAPEPAPMTPPAPTYQAPTRAALELAEEAVVRILLANCGTCHSRASGREDGDIGFIGDLDRMVREGLIVPLSSAESPLIRAILDGSMPPPGSGVAPMPDIDFDYLIDYIDNPVYWGDVATPPILDDAAAPSIPDLGTDGG